MSHWLGRAAFSRPKCLQCLRRLSSKTHLLPGLGRPLNYIPVETEPDYVGRLLPNALDPGHIWDGCTTVAPLTLREFNMLQFMNSITDKVDWAVKVHKNDIAQKWKEEALSSGTDISQKMADYCVDELRYKVSIYPSGSSGTSRPPIVVFPGNVVKSDTAVSSELKAALQNAVKMFENAIPEESKDWHPESNKMVWDLVHPSLYPLVFGRTKVLPQGQITTLEDCHKQLDECQVVPVPPKEEASQKSSLEMTTWWGSSADQPKDPYSRKFQWLPCEVDISGEHSRITSYINNLHPKETQLYKLIAQLIDASIPLWNATLTPLAQSHPAEFRRIGYAEVKYDPDPWSLSESEGPQPREGENECDYEMRRQIWIDDTRVLVLPEPREFIPPPELEVFDLKNKFAKQGLQVIVKLANIELTPEKPRYEGGSWHVEGHLNEHIAATSIYYYSSENITPSSLSFRQQIDTQPIEFKTNYRQDDHEWLKTIYGCEQAGPAVQELGSVATSEGRLLTFPNVVQHRVGPFELEDSSKPGHRKIVALFLVDPHMKIISTARVPCQQQDLRPENTEDRAQQEELNSPFTLGVAKELRLELMEERKGFQVTSAEGFEWREVFSLCEH